MYATNTGMGAGNMKLTLACACALSTRAATALQQVQECSSRVGDELTRAATGLPDIIELIRSNIPVVFTCANDYADVKASRPSACHSIPARCHQALIIHLSFSRIYLSSSILHPSSSILCSTLNILIFVLRVKRSLCKYNPPNPTPPPTPPLRTASPPRFHSRPPERPLRPRRCAALQKPVQRRSRHTQRETPPAPPPPPPLLSSLPLHPPDPYTRLAVTTVHAPEARDTTWSCPNAFVYMIKVWRAVAAVLRFVVMLCAGVRGG